jgi:peptide/nickel transport system permease protein
VVGYAGGWLDHLVMRFLDMFFAFPLVLVAIVVAGILSPGLLTIMLAIVVALVPYITRLVRTTTISVSTQSYVEAARAGGATAGAILMRYVLPNTVPPVIVYTTTLIGLMMVLGSALSFLGLGVQPPTADWGLMVSEGRTVLRRAPHITIFPGLAIVLVSLAFGFIGDGLRDALDPRAR